MIINTRSMRRSRVLPQPRPRAGSRKLRGLDFGALEPPPTAPSTGSVLTSSVGVRLSPPPLPAGATRVGGEGDIITLGGAATIYYGAGGNTSAYARVFAPGGTKCAGANFGRSAGGACYALQSEASPWNQLTSYLPGGYPERGGTLAKKVADQGQAFQTNDPVTVYYGTIFNEWNVNARPQRFMVNDVLPGSYMCDNNPFGPDPAPGTRKACWIVPHLAPEVPAPITYDERLAAQQAAEERATAATQAQQDVYAAQQALAQQQADAAAQIAQMARDAASQAAAASNAAEAYRKIQEQAQTQAAQMAAQLAQIAAANSADADAARAAADVAAQAESIRQATEQARSTEEARARSYLAAQAAALNADTEQRQYEAKLQAAQNAAATAAGLATQPGASGLDMQKILLYGGLGVAALLVIMSVGE